MADELTIAELIERAHANATAKGWWSHERSFGDQIALMHSELSEALEEHRNHHGLDSIYYHETPQGPKPEGVASELADVLIRIFDTCGRYGIPLEQALREKMDYNENRPYRHGGKAL